MKKKITTTELASFIAQREGTSKNSAEAFVRKFFEVIERGLLEDKYVKIKGLGTFKLVIVGERESVNVQTGERFQISGHTKVAFTPDNALKELVNRPFAHFIAVDLNDDTETEEFEAIDQRMAEEYKDLENSNEEESEDLTEEEEEDSKVEETEETPAADESQKQELPDTDDAASTPESYTESTPTAEADGEAEVQASQTSASEDESTEDQEEPEIHTDSPIIPISTGEVSHEASTPTSSTEPTLKEAGTITLPAEDTPQEDETEDLSSQDAEQDETVEPMSHHEAKDICVSAPHPINHHTERSATNLPPTSNSMGYSYSEVPSRKKRNWWKAATITICAVLLMACCYYIGYFRLLCPTCGFTPLFDNGSNATQPSEQKVQTNTLSRPTSPVKQKETTQGNGSTSDSAPQGTNTSTPQATASESPSKEQPKPATQTSSEKDTGDKSVASSSPKSQTNTNSTPSSAEKAPAQPQSTFHKVKAGENLTRIVRRHYGSDAYVNLVIKRNHLKNADNVTVGMVLELPPNP